MYSCLFLQVSASCTSSEAKAASQPPAEETPATLASPESAEQHVAVDPSYSNETAPDSLSIQDAFAGRTVFLTGATGFVGSLVLEQLLRTCPEIQKIYVLVRQKRNVPPHQRIHQLLCTNPLFHHFTKAAISDSSSNAGTTSNSDQTARMQADEEENFGDVICKVEAIPGDLTLPGFGIAADDMKKLHAETEVVIHAAASISFDDHIHDAIMHNYTVRSAFALP